MNLLCPRCKQRFDEHEDGHCPKRLSRRFFLGDLGGAVAAAALAKFDVATPAADSLIAVAGPKVHHAASIVLEGGSLTRMDIEYIAAKTRRSVIGTHNGDVIHFVDAVKERLL